MNGGISILRVRPGGDKVFQTPLDRLRDDAFGLLWRIEEYRDAVERRRALERAR